MTGEVQEWNAINFLSRNTVLDEQPLFNQSFLKNRHFKLKFNMPMACVISA